MGWFDEQIRQRKLHDQNTFENAFLEISDAVTGARISEALADHKTRAKSAIDEILKFYHAKTQDVPETIQDLNEQLEYLTRPYGIMRRSVRLEKGWYRDAFGAMLGVRKSDGSVVALIPGNLSGYTFFDAETGKRVRVSRKNEDLFEPEAIAFYKPFPVKKMDIGSFLRYIAGSHAGCYADRPVKPETDAAAVRTGRGERGRHAADVPGDLRGLCDDLHAADPVREEPVPRADPDENGRHRTGGDDGARDVAPGGVFQGFQLG